jgi:hypothetical protein
MKCSGARKAEAMLCESSAWLEQEAFKGMM